MAETTLRLNEVPVLSRPGLQLYIVIIDLIMGLFVGDFLGGMVGFRLPCTVAGAILGVALGVVTARKLGGATTPRSITIDATHMRLLLPKKNIVAVPLEEVRSIEERGKNRRRMLIISTRRRLFVFPWMAFGLGMPELLRDIVRVAVAHRPHGSELVAAMERREQLGRDLMRRRPRVVLVLLLCVLVGFAVESIRGAFGSPAALLALGGNAPVLVADGQWWRLFTANFLHASFLHYSLNVLAVLLLGGFLERLVGALRTLSISLVAGTGGNVASALAATHVFSVGISGMVFGMMGALMVVSWRSRKVLPGVFRIGWGTWALLLGLNGLISFLPGIDGWAHLGGLVGGAAAALMLVPNDLDRTRTQITVFVVSAVLALAYIVALGAAMRHKSDAQADFLHAGLDNPRLSAVSLNDFAWRVAINPATNTDELATIERATQRLVDENPHEGSYRDTHAYVLHRERRLDQAFEQQRIALTGVEKDAVRANLYTMFFRFLMERGPFNADAATVRRDGGDIVIECTVPGAVIFALDPNHGLVRIILPEGERVARVAAPHGVGDGALAVWLVDGSGPEARTSTAQISFAPRDAATAALP